VGHAFKAVEEAFAMLADGKVDVPQVRIKKRGRKGGREGGF
jgi:hypothetical protein